MNLELALEKYEDNSMHLEIEEKIDVESMSVTDTLYTAAHAYFLLDNDLK